MSFFGGSGGSGQGSNFTAGSGGSGGQQQQQQRRVHPIRPLTIKQLTDAQRVGDGVTVVDGREITQATVVGRITGYESQNAAGGAITAKHYGYHISDGTGTLLVRQWMEADSVEEPLPLQYYVRVSGTVKVWQGNPIVTGTVRPVSDCNELNFHFLDSVLTHLRLTKGNARPASNQPASVANSANTIGAQNILPGGNEKLFATDVLMRVIKQSGGGATGLSMDELTAAAQRYGFGVQDVRTAMRSLTAEGKVYQTHDNRFSM